MNLYLIRHTKTEYPESVCYGMTDVNLENNYHEIFPSVKNKIENNIRVISSPLKRCSLLADYISENNYSVDDRIKELNFGDWELKNWSDIPRNELDLWYSDIHKYTFPNGENYNNFFSRVHSFFSEQKRQNEDVVVVTHGGVIRTIIGIVLDLPTKNLFRLKIDYGSLSKIKIENNLMFLEKLNV